jgi:sirohydrochlorin ferrochelatase
MRKYGVLVISHGSRDPRWVRLVDEAVADVRAPEGVPVNVSFLEIVEGRLIQDGIDELESQGVTDLVTVPLFVSAGSTHVSEIAFALGVLPEPEVESDLEPFRVNAKVHYLAPIDDDPDIAQVVYDNIRELSTDPAREILLLIGHGSNRKGFHKRWRNGLDRLAARVQALGGFAGAVGAMLRPNQVACKLEVLRRKMPDCRVIAAPFFLSEGYFTNTVIPARLEGFDCLYNGRTLLPDPLVTRWMERRIADFFNR